MFLRLTALALLVMFVCSTTGCASKAQREADFLRASLTQGTKSPVEAKTTSGTSTTGNTIQIVTLSFLIDEPAFTYRDQANELLISRGYTQAMNLSTPDEFSIAYDGLAGRIHVEILAEVALPSASEMTELPIEDLPKEEAKEPPKPPQEPANENKPPQIGIGAGTQEKEPAKPETPTNIHRITIKISY